MQAYRSDPLSYYATMFDSLFISIALFCLGSLLFLILIGTFIGSLFLLFLWQLYYPSAVPRIFSDIFIIIFLLVGFGSLIVFTGLFYSTAISAATSGADRASMFMSDTYRVYQEEMIDKATKKKSDE